MTRTPPPRFGVPAGYCVLAGKRNKQAKDKQMTFTAIVWSKEKFVTWRCAACLLSRKDCSVMKKINSTNNAEQPRPPALNRWVALSAFGDRRELLHECAKPRPPAPNKNKTNLDENSKFVLFFTRDYFGLRVS